ncbi:MAG: phosphodiesterase [Erysipelotrichia bacterium]|nr:phosphodiesterase [Erysipelotrichia bacterium]NCC53903.1 phosphodiesterase [Erysipelotrichia bacterium]
MKLLIASDIHGSAYYAEKIANAYHKHQCDKLLLLGDLLYHGPRNPLPKEYEPKKVITILNELKENIIAVRGNCDAEVDQMVLDFPMMSDYTTIVMEDYKILASHGHIYHPDHLPALNENDVFLYGHIHIPVMEKRNGIHIINPSSITLPKENNPHTYGVLMDKTFSLYDEDDELLKTYHF